LGEFSSDVEVFVVFCRLCFTTVTMSSSWIAEKAMPAVINNLVFTILAFIAVSLRIGTRLFLIKNMGVDDTLIVIAMVSRYSFSSFSFLLFLSSFSFFFFFSFVPPSGHQGGIHYGTSKRVTPDSAPRLYDMMTVSRRLQW
jgi:hypothetical protein